MGGEKAVCLQDSLRKAEPPLGTITASPSKGSRTFSQRCWTSRVSLHGAPHSHGPCGACDGERLCLQSLLVTEHDTVC